MPQSIPVVGRNAVIQMGGTTIGYAIGVHSAGVKADLIKEFALGSPKAAILAQGNMHFSVDVEKMFIDSTYITQVMGGTPVDFVLAPAGTSAGNVKITIKNVVLTVYDYKADQKGVVTEKVSGEGTDFQTGTW
jgi:hypothetical protein